MGRLGAAGDIAPTESFFALLQKNVLNRGARTARNELASEIIRWIENTYHQRRRQRALGRRTPSSSKTLLHLAGLAA